MKNQNIKPIHLVFVSLFILLIALSVNSKRLHDTAMAYQAYLTDSEGQAISGNYSITIRLYIEESDPTPLWEETQSINIADGLLALYLGDSTILADSVLKQSNYLSISINGETLTPFTRLTSSPSSVYSKTSTGLDGNIITSGSSLFIPGDDPLTTPKTVEILKQASTPMLNLYPGNEWLGGSDTAVSISHDTEGGYLGIWGTNGTSRQVELRANAGGGIISSGAGDDAQIILRGGSFETSLNLYPGNEWLTGSDTAMSLSFDGDGGYVGIWGSNGTARQVDLRTTTNGGQLGIWGSAGTAFPQVKIGTSQDGGFARFDGIDGESLEKVEIDVGDGAGNIGIWGTNGTAFPRLALYGDSFGGKMVLRDTSDFSAITFDGAATGDNAMILPNDAINNDEIIDEPGLAQNQSSSCIAVSTSMSDIITVTITIPSAGYIFITGSGMVEFGNTLSSNRLDVQIDETAGGSSINGYFSRIGLAGYVSQNYNSFDFCVTRTYYKAIAGSYTFRLEADRFNTLGTADICFPTLTAVYLPTSYGTVNTVVENINTNRGSLSSSTQQNHKTIDLRNLEIKFRKEKEEALKAELEYKQALLNQKSEKY